MRRDQTVQTVGGLIAGLSLVLLVVFDIITGPTIVFASLFALAPMIACAVLPVLATAAYAAAAIALATASGLWNHSWGTAQQTVRIIDVALISVTAILVAAVRIHRERQHARVVAIAEAAQRAILPTVPAAIGEVAVATRYVSAAQDAVVGGDLYDCYHSATCTRFLVGDVRGKGIAAVEQAARVIRAFRQAAPVHADLGDVGREMSGYLAPFFDEEEFVTALLVDVTLRNRIQLVSCGHPPPLLVRHTGCATLLDSPAGLPLGLGRSYTPTTVPWQEGERLLLYTDGLSEARDQAGDFMPLPPLAPLLASGGVDRAADNVLDAVRRYVPHGHLHDDLALVLLENGGSATQLAGTVAGSWLEATPALTT